MQMTRSVWIQFGVLLVIVAIAGWVVSPLHPRLTIGAFTRDLNVHYGLDLQGGAHLVYEARIGDISPEDAAEALAGVRDVIERRVNAFGVAEPLVQTNRLGDTFRIIVELAGVYDTSEAIKRIGETPQLDFRYEVSPDEVAQQFNIDGDTQITGPVFARSELTGRDLKRATVSFDQTTGTPIVNLEFNQQGSELFAQLTREHIGERIAIYLDEVPISAPVVQAEITNGRAVISGGFDLEEAKELSQRLNAGALPIPIDLVGQQTVGPSLGRLSIQQSIIAGILGLVAVMAWMIIFYRLPGLLAAIALCFYLLFFLTIIKLLPVTLTLAGIAGLILSVGMAVDANVLVFERLRENLRAGKPLDFALQDGFSEAWDSIRDSNISSLLTAVILYALGTSIIRGFALTFSLGIILSMLTAIGVTRTLLSLVLRWSWARKPGLLNVESITT